MIKIEKVKKRNKLKNCICQFYYLHTTFAGH